MKTGAFVLSVLTAAGVSAPALAVTAQGKADLIYECATSLEWAERHSNRNYRITSDMVWDNYDTFARFNNVSMEEADASLQGYWDEIREATACRLCPRPDAQLRLTLSNRHPRGRILRER